MRQILLLIALLLPFFSFAQLNEAFNGPEVTSTYPWEGDTEKFIINEQGELQLKGRHFKDDAFLYLSTVPLFDNKWRFTVRSDYQGTTSNYFKIYLWTEKPDKTNPGEAVFIRLGYSKKNIALCHQIGNLTPDVLVQGRALFSGPQQVEVKVETDARGKCTVYSKSSSDEDFIKEGSADLPTRGGNGYFMIGVYYSTEHNNNKYIDSIQIDRFTLQSKPEKPEEPDEPLEILDVKQKNEYELSLHFNRSIDISEAYFRLSELGETKEITYSEKYFILTLKWDKPMEKDKEYTLEFEGIYTGEFKYYGDVPWTSLYGTKEPEGPDPADYGSILINEIMADPKGIAGLPETEYVELFNNTSTDISLKGWSFIYDGKPTLLNDNIIPSGSYLVLYREGRDITIGEKGIKMPLSKFPAQLANNGKALQIQDGTGRVIDEVTYEKAKPGIAWERHDEEWFLSTDERGGTPGEANSTPGDKPNKPNPSLDIFAKPGEIVFNELLPNPYPDGSEYIELYNRTDVDISLSDLCIATRKTDGTLSTQYSLSEIPVLIKSRDYLLLTRSKDGVTGYYRIQSPYNIHEIKLPVLNNTGATLVLFRPEDETIIDEVSYSFKWHSSSVKEEKGVALERIDPDKGTQDATNWTSASETSGYGTPGYLNSQFGISNPNPNNTSGIEKPAYSKETGLYSILYYLDQPGYNCKASIFDLSGRKVGDIANNDLMGMSGELIWDGIGSNGSRLKTGLYILYIELYHTSGKVKKHKEVFLIY